jgi:hypothetical protein
LLDASGGFYGASFDATKPQLNPMQQNQDEHDNQNDTEHPGAAVPVPIAVTAKAATEATGQEYDQKYD